MIKNNQNWESFDKIINDNTIFNYNKLPNWISCLVDAVADLSDNSQKNKTKFPIIEYNNVYYDLRKCVHVYYLINGKLHIAPYHNNTFIFKINEEQYAPEYFYLDDILDVNELPYWVKTKINIDKNNKMIFSHNNIEYNLFNKYFFMRKKNGELLIFNKNNKIYMKVID